MLILELDISSIELPRSAFTRLPNHIFSYSRRHRKPSCLWIELQTRPLSLPWYRSRNCATSTLPPPFKSLNRDGIVDSAKKKKKKTCAIYN